MNDRAPQPPDRQTRFLAEFLAETSIACPGCKHDLRGSSGDRCPECGVPLRMRIDSPVATPGIWWWLGVFGTGLAIAISLRMVHGSLDKIIALADDPKLPLVVRGGFAPNSALPNWTGIVFLIACSLACLATMALLLTHRRQFARMPGAVRIVLGFGLFVMPIWLLVLVRAYIAVAQ